ncbi:M16 family metallopeptidase [Bacteroidota bacterium]
MKLNRVIQPNFKNIEHIDIPAPQESVLENGIKTYIINAGTQDVLKIDVVFQAGNWHQKKSIIASTVNEMLVEGSKNLTSQQIAEKLDYYGAFIHAQPTKDFSNITLYTLRKYLPETIQILDEVIKYPTFNENELSTFLGKKKQKFQIELEKVTNIAQREFNEQLFGNEHPYGIKTQIDDFDNINQVDLIEFHEKYYNPDNCKIIISGKIDDSDILLVNQYLGNIEWESKAEPDFLSFDIPKQAKLESVIEKENVTQSAIRVGKLSLNKNHPDYHKLNMVNTLLGGYFGSRLMKSIREEKGYTYGINSVLIALKHGDYLVILSEVGASVAKNAIKDIKTEIKKLREKEVSQEELDLVKNYMLGDLLRSFDGPFEIASSFKDIIDLGLNMNFYTKEIETIKTITPAEINFIANKYFHEDSLVKTIAGKYN